MIAALLLALAVQGAPRLYPIQLPAGDVPGFSIDFANWSGHQAERKYRSDVWLRDADGDGSPDYDGVVFVGAGRGATHIRPGNAEATILVARHGGIVRIEGATIHCGRSQGIFFGLETPGVPVQPKFRLELQSCEVLSDPPVATAASLLVEQEKAARGPPEGERSAVLIRSARSGALPPGLRHDELGDFNAYRSWTPEVGPSLLAAATAPTTTKWGICPLIYPANSMNRASIPACLVFQLR